MRIKLSGRTMAYLLLAAGTAATVAANYAHAHENVGAKALSAVVPVLLFIAFHVAAEDGRWWIRFTTGVVSVLCFSISYDHISALARSYGESGTSAVLYPLAIDGAMIVATFVLSRTADKVPSAPPVVVPAPVRKTEDKPALSVVPEKIDGYIGDKPRTNGFVRPMPPVRKSVPAQDNDARLSAIHEIAEALGDKLSRTALLAGTNEVKGLRARGFAMNTTEAAAIVRNLKADRVKA